MTLRHVLAAAALTGSLLIGATGQAAAMSVDGPVPAPITATTPVSEARALYHRVLFTDGCEADFQAIYVGLIMPDAITDTDDTFVVPSEAYRPMVHLYVENEANPGC